MKKQKIINMFILIFFQVTALGFTWKKPMNDSMLVISMNIHCFQNNWEFRLTKILEELIIISPDIVSFQEVCSDENNNSADQIEFIRSYLTKHSYPLKTLETQFTHKAWDKFNEHLVIFSKHFPKDIEKGLLPDSPLDRGYVALKINNAWYVNTHLEHRSDYSNYRKIQIDFLIKKFKQFPHLFMGDFNSSPETDEQRSLHRSNYHAFFPGTTHLGQDGNTMKNIDGFWISPTFEKKVYSTSSKIILNQQVNGAYLSDHFGVQLSLNFR